MRSGSSKGWDTCSLRDITPRNTERDDHTTVRQYAPSMEGLDVARLVTAARDGDESA
jgi:hypothetical protein